MDKPIPHADAACALVLTTLPDRDAALAMARALVEARLAACVQVVDGLTSVYRWEGRLEENAECQLTAKTTPGLAAALAARIREVHPYQVPEVLVLDAEASEAYGAWVRKETGS
jgi:periplasmic divalent cation tolerance protein